MPVDIIDGSRFRRELTRLKLSQRDFCTRHFIREATLSEVLHGHPVGPETLFVIARALEVEQARAEQ
jgi:transcriptional regulator with XRE-family HTH domain